MAAGVTNAGLNHILSTEFCDGSPIGSTSWYLGLINNSPSPTFSASDTNAGGGHSGWAEVAPSTGYSGNRKAWTQGAASGQAVTNSGTVNFSMSNSFTVYGVFLVSVSSSTGGTLFATAAFSGGTQSVGNGDTLQVTFTISAASG